MDVGAKRHYVTAAIDLVRTDILRLLILLSALITGLTGLIAGQPAVARTGEPAAIAMAFAGGIEQAGKIVQARDLRPQDLPGGDSRRDEATAPPAFVAQLHPVDERRIE